MAGLYPLPFGLSDAFFAAAFGAAAFFTAGAFLGAAAFTSAFTAFTAFGLATGAAVFLAGFTSALAGAGAAAISRSRRMVNMRARSVRSDRSFLIPSACPIDIWKR